MLSYCDIRRITVQDWKTPVIAMLEMLVPLFALIPHSCLKKNRKEKQKMVTTRVELATSGLFCIIY